MSRHDDETPFTICHDGLASESAHAMCFWKGTHRIMRKKFWVPLSVIVDYDDSTVDVKTWWAEKEGYA